MIVFDSKKLSILRFGEKEILFGYLGDKKIYEKSPKIQYVKFNSFLKYNNFDSKYNSKE